MSLEGIDPIGEYPSQGAGQLLISGRQLKPRGNNWKTAPSCSFMAPVRRPSKWRRWSMPCVQPAVTRRQWQ